MTNQAIWVFYYNRRGVDDKTTGTATFVGNVNGAGLTINGSGGTHLGTALNHTFSGAVDFCRNAECRLQYFKG
jgi:hypothetical protein